MDTVQLKSKVTQFFASFFKSSNKIACDSCVSNESKKLFVQCAGRTLIYVDVHNSTNHLYDFINDFVKYNVFTYACDIHGEVNQSSDHTVNGPVLHTYIESRITEGTEQINRNLSNKFFLLYAEKPLRHNHKLSDYDIHDCSTIKVAFPMLLGGSPDKIILPTYQIVKDCEKAVIAKTQSSQSINKLKVQSADTEETNDRENSAINNMMGHILEGIAKLPPLDVDMNWIIKQIENFSIIKTFSQKCENFNEYYCLTQMSYRLFTGEVLSTKIDLMIKSLFTTEVQSFDIGESLMFLRKAFDGVSNVTDSPLAKKMVSLYSYLLTQGFLKTFGMTLNDEDYSKMEQRAYLSAYSSKKSFYVCIIDTVLFIAERLHEYQVTGEITTFIHSSSKYTKWLKEADRVINLAPFTGNLQAHGTSYFAYIADLRDLCEQGNAYKKYLSLSSGIEATLIDRKLNTLKMLSNTEITRRSAMKERVQPMGVLVHGHSSIAKSAFTKMLFNYYGSLYDLSRGDDFRYVRNPMDEYWSNFDSSKWCIQLDDIAFKHPSKSADIDSTLQDLLNVVNNVPYVPPQAALEDKGKTPVLAELVIATTNCETLNAQEYFWCPLAVRRRLPFIVSLTPKAEFLHENRTFIDPSKINIPDGQFPDLWNITVKNIVPRMQHGREMADLEEVEVFTDIKKFLQFFGKACNKHKQNQAKAMTSDVSMRTIEVCKKCLLPLPHEQCIELQSCDATLFMSFWFFNTITTFILSYAFIWNMFDYFVTKPITSSLVFRIVNRINDNTKVMAFYGRYAEFKRGAQNKKLCAALSIISLLIGTYCVYTNTQKSTNKKEVKVESSKITETSDDEDLLEVQGNKFGSTEEQFSKEERTNVWYNPTVELTTFDVPLASASLNGATPEKLHETFGKNCVMLRIKLLGESTTRVIRGTFVKGHICITNAHAFKDTSDDKQYEINIIQSNVCEGINSNIKISLNTKNIVFSKKTDLCVFQVDSIPPFKDITKYWQTNAITPSSCMELIRQPDGSIEKRTIYGLTYMNDMPVNDMPQNTYSIHFGHSDQITEVGLCGSLCIANTPRGPIIIGQHMLGSEYRIGILNLTIDQLNILIGDSKLSQRPIVQSGTMPSMECESRKHVLGPLHHKSLTRYIEQGTVNVYGSFEGFRPKPKSKVCATPLQAQFLEHFSTTVGYDKPAMSGWEPWRKNVIEMVKPNVTHDKTILQDCVNAYAADIISGLPKDWERDLMVLSDISAVNGLPGVIYIDGINRNSSMGFPWCKSKSGFLHEKKTDKHPEGVDFVPEVWEKVQAIETKYQQGQRCNPIFTGHLKDEATPIAKCEAKKTRLFTGAPIDWSIVVRKNLLTFVRLVQKNKFIFEAGPGVVTQSNEWGRVYEYLTKFGKDQLVAGDYGKFDKRMIADIVLAVFEVITIVHKAAGFNEQELLTIMCIGEDTAFPMCNVNGDLMEFFGTNPSGHPLTVIVNSMANSLYLRYCYAKLNPLKEVTSFQRNVALFTYGDDNVFGVNRTIPWFNHTTIQSELLKIGVEYTMADKTSLSVPYINIDQVSFLKRLWVWNDEIKGYLCPLEEASIIKSLTVWVPSGSIDKYKQTVAVVVSANNEYFFYGREKFEKEHKFFEELLTQEPYCYYTSKTTLPSFDELVERWRRASSPDLNDLE